MYANLQIVLGVCQRFAETMDVKYEPEAGGYQDIVHLLDPLPAKQLEYIEKMILLFVDIWNDSLNQL